MHNDLILYLYRKFPTAYDEREICTSLTAKMHLVNLLNKTNFQNDKEHLDSSEPLLFNFYNIIIHF